MTGVLRQVICPWLHIFCGFAIVAELREKEKEGLGLQCSTQCCLNGTFKQQCLRNGFFFSYFPSHSETHRYRETHKRTPQVIPLVLLNVVWGNASRKGWGVWKGRDRAAWREFRKRDPRERVSRICESLHVLLCLVPEKQRCELIVRLFQLRHSQWTEDTKHDFDIRSPCSCLNMYSNFFHAFIMVFFSENSPSTKNPLQ